MLHMCTIHYENAGAVMIQWLFLVPAKGGRDYITSQKARIISGI